MKPSNPTVGLIVVATAWASAVYDNNRARSDMAACYDDQPVDVVLCGDLP